MGFGDTFGFFQYDSDDQNGYVVKLSTQVALQGGFAPVENPLSLPGYPYGPKNMRHVWGRASSGERTRLPVSGPDNARFTSGGTFTLTGREYVIEGAIGEARKLSSLGG